jgi:hypothetical protein
MKKLLSLILVYLTFSGSVYLGRYPLTTPISQGMDFDGTDDYIDLGTTSTYSALTGAMSVQCWINADLYSVSVPHRFIAKFGGSGARGWNLCYEVAPQDSLEFAVSSNSTTPIAVSDDGLDGTVFAPSAGTWYHLVGVYTPSTSLKLYVNGSIYDTNTTSIPASQYQPSIEPRIGQRSDSTSYGYNGKMAEVAIWDTALTAEEVTTLYTAGKGAPLIVQSDNLIDYWALDDIPVGESGDGDSFNSQGSGNNDGVGVDGANNTGLTSVTVSI